MRYLGIDFGSKRVGVALSDPDNRYAIPEKILANDKNLYQNLINLITENSVTDIVIGESRNYRGEKNIIMKKATDLAKKLESGTSLAVHFEPEFLTSAEAKRIQGDNKSIDASAAAIILKSFLERKA